MNAAVAVGCPASALPIAPQGPEDALAIECAAVLAIIARPVARVNASLIERPWCPFEETKLRSLEEAFCRTEGQRQGKQYRPRSASGRHRQNDQRPGCSRTTPGFPAAAR